MTVGFRRIGDRYLLALDADEAQALGLVIAQVAGLVQSHRSTSPGGVPGSGAVTGAGGTAAHLARIAGVEAAAVNPVDSALARLFPDGYTDDAEAAAELRRLTQGTLREQKIRNATAVLDALPLEGGEVHLDADGAEAWLLALNDARLVVGTRLDLDDDTDLLVELDDAVLADPTSPRVLALSVYQFLSYLQETLIQALDPEYGT